MIDLIKIIQEIKDEHPEYDFNSPDSIVNHCSYFGICVMQKLKNNGRESSTLLLKINNKDIPNDSILKKEYNFYSNHNVVLFENKIIDLTRLQFGTLIENDITDKNTYLKKWVLVKETKSNDLNLRAKEKTTKKFKR